MSTTKSRIGTISLVAVPATDQDRSIEFYEALGFEKRTDIPFGDKYRWVEVYPPSGTTGIALAPPPPGVDQTGVETGIILTTDDIDATHAQLQVGRRRRRRRGFAHGRPRAADVLVPRPRRQLADDRPSRADAASASDRLGSSSRDPSRSAGPAYHVCGS